MRSVPEVIYVDTNVVLEAQRTGCLSDILERFDATASPAFVFRRERLIRRHVLSATASCLHRKRSSHSGLWERIADGKDFTPIMPKKQTIERARRDEREGKAASTQAGEFVREEIDEIRAGKHGARSTKQAIAIGLSKARRAGVKLPPPEKGKTSEATRRKAQRDLEKAESGEKPSRRRSQATLKALKRERTDAASPEALSQQAHTAAGKRSKAERSTAAKKAARTRRMAR